MYNPIPLNIAGIPNILALLRQLLEPFLFLVGPSTLATRIASRHIVLLD
jgi:hypothetical protein